jgi:hypothetical protein
VGKLLLFVSRLVWLKNIVHLILFKVPLNEDVSTLKL